MDGAEAEAGMVGMEGEARLEGTVKLAGAAATVVGVELAAGALLGRVGCPLTVGAAS